MKHYFITGASSGIGAALARALTRRGQRVTGMARRVEKLNELATKLPGFHAVAGDVTDQARMENAITAADQAAAIDTIILNAGIYTPQDGSQIDVDQFRQHIEVNYMGVVHGIAAVLPGMIARGRGHIVIVASVAGWRGLPKAAAYSPTKAALIALAESLRFDLEPKGIKIQLVSPGFVETEATAINDFDMPGLVSAETAAHAILTGMDSNRFEICFPKGFTRMMRLLALLPHRLYYTLVSRRTS